MTKYIVSIPITGSCSFEVEAASTHGATVAAWAAVNAGTEGDVTWEYTEKVTTGNVCHAMQNEVEVTRVRESSPSLPSESHDTKEGNGKTQ